MPAPVAAAARDAALSHPIEVNTMSASFSPPPELERHVRLIAYLDTVLESDFALRYFDWNPAWDKRERLFAMHSGEGDHAFVWFGPAGCLMRGKMEGKRPVAEPKLFAGLPATLEAVRDEAAFQMGGDSFALWWSSGDKEWRWAVDPEKGGLARLSRFLEGGLEGFAEYARDYHEVKLDAAALGAFYDSGTVTRAWLAELSPTIDVDRGLEVAKELGLSVKKQRVRKTKRKTKSKNKTGKGRPAPEEVDGRMGDGEFRVVRLGDDTMLIVGDQIQLQASRAGLYYEVLDGVRTMLRAAGAR